MQQSTSLGGQRIFGSSEYYSSSSENIALTLTFLSYGMVVRVKRAERRCCTTAQIGGVTTVQKWSGYGGGNWTILVFWSFVVLFWLRDEDWPQLVFWSFVVLFYWEARIEPRSVFWRLLCLFLNERRGLNPDWFFGFCCFVFDWVARIEPRSPLSIFISAMIHIVSIKLRIDSIK